MKEEEATPFADLLFKMLEYLPHKRISAQESLRHPWLKMPKNLNFRLNEAEIKKKLSSMNKNHNN